MAWMLVMADPLLTLPCRSCQENAVYAHHQQRLCCIGGAVAGQAGDAAAGRQQRGCPLLHAVPATFALLKHSFYKLLLIIINAMASHLWQAACSNAPNAATCGSMHHVLWRVRTLKGVRRKEQGNSRLSRNHQAGSLPWGLCLSESECVTV